METHDLEALNKEELAYESERLVVEFQEAIATSLAASGLTRAGLAARIGRNRSFITRALSSGSNLTLKSLAAIALGAGYRLRVSAEPLVKSPVTQYSWRSAVPSRGDYQLERPAREEVPPPPVDDDNYSCAA